MMDSDATSLYPSAMWHGKIVYPKIKTGLVFKPFMKDNNVEAFNNQLFNQDGNENAILKVKNHNPTDVIFQHLPVKEKVKNIEGNLMRNGYIKDTLTSVDIQKIVEIGGETIEIYEDVFLWRKL